VGKIIQPGQAVRMEKGETPEEAMIRLTGNAKREKGVGEHGLTRAEAIDVSAQLEAQGFVLYGPRVALIRDPAEAASKSIIITDDIEEKKLRGTIVLIGHGAQVDEDGNEMGLRNGDRITFSKYNNTLFELPLIDGSLVYVEVVHVNNLYIGWRH